MILLTQIGERGMFTSFPLRRTGCWTDKQHPPICAAFPKGRPKGWNDTCSTIIWKFRTTWCWRRRAYTFMNQYPIPFGCNVGAGKIFRTCFLFPGRKKTLKPFFFVRHVLCFPVKFIDIGMFWSHFSSARGKWVRVITQRLLAISGMSAVLGIRWKLIDFFFFVRIKPNWTISEDVW